MSENPFSHRGPIRDPDYFYGRARETYETLRMLRHAQCISIVGPRRIGKTSLLLHFFNSDVRERHGLEEKYLFVYVDCQSMGNLDKSQLYQWLWGEAKRALAEWGEAGDWTDSISGFREFREAVMAAGDRGYKLVFFLDEFETIATNSHLDRDAFNDLRSLVPAVVYVTASQDPLIDLSYTHKDIVSSPFFVVFEQIYLGFLTPGEAEEMISGLLGMAEQEDFFTEEELIFVFEIAGYHPFFLQLACYHLFDRKMERGKLAAEDYGVVRRQYAESAKGFFRYIWKNLKGGEQGAVRLVCGGETDQIRDEQRGRLKRECLLHNNSIFSSVFAEFVEGQVPRTRAVEKTKRRGVPKQFKKASVALVVILSVVLFSAMFAGFDLSHLTLRTLVALAVTLFVLSVVLTGPDLLDLVLKTLGVENVTPISMQNAPGEILAKVYSPKLLLVGEAECIRVQPYGSEEPEFEVVVDPSSSDVAITQEGNAYEIECKSTDNVFSRSKPIRLKIKATVPAGVATASVTVKTNHFISLLARVGTLLGSVGFSFSAKKLWEWLRAIGERK
jgi:hypothetical protein